MIPVAKLDSALIRTTFMQLVQQLVEIDIDLVCCLVDGHSINRKFYKHEMCGGILKDNVVDPADRSLCFSP